MPSLEEATFAEGWKCLDVAVVGGGIGGLAAATSFRRAGHKVTIYEKNDYAGEIGASISCAANGTRWLHEWNCDISLGKSVNLQGLILRDWETGKIQNVYDMSDYERRWGWRYNMFHRVNMHEMLMASAVGEGEGFPSILKLNHPCQEIDLEKGVITFANGITARHDLIVGADGIGSAVRACLGIKVEKKQSTSTCYHCIIETTKVKKLGLVDYTTNSAIEFWGGKTRRKIVFSPCRSGEIASFYCFFDTDKSNHAGESWKETATTEQLLAPFDDLDPDLLALFTNSSDIKPWRLFVHQPYPYWQKGRVCILGDAAHPMMPDQSQGACQALEDAAALGIIFGRKYGFASEVEKGLRLYQNVRKGRATRVQEASAKARENITERIGFSSNTDNPMYEVEDESRKLTIDEMNVYNMNVHVQNLVSGKVTAKIGGVVKEVQPNESALTY